MPTKRIHNLENLQSSGHRDATGCLLWGGYRNRKGYGVVRVTRDRIELVSRLVLTKKLGRELRPGECALHTCDNPPCFEESHLFVGSNADNAHDSAVKGRRGDQRGEKSVRAKLTDDQVRAIRRIRSIGFLSDPEIGKQFGVSRTTIRRVALGLRWGHIK